MPTYNLGENINMQGTLDVSSGTLTTRSGQISRSSLRQEDDTLYAVPLAEVYVWDDLASRLPGTAATDDLGIIEGTWGTDAPTLQTSDAKATTVTQYGRFLIPLPPEYVLAQTLQIRFWAGMITTISDGTATIDLEVYVGTSAGSVGNNLCATAAQSINSLTAAAYDFTITNSGLAQSDMLDCRVTVAITDAATGTAVLGEIQKIGLLADIKG